MNTQFHCTNLAALCACFLGISTVQGAVVIQGDQSSHVAFEAETESLIINSAPSRWEIKNDATASGSAALYAAGTTDTGTSPQSFIQYQIKFSKAGTYHLYYRWKADAERTVADQFTANSSWIANAFGAISAPGAATQAEMHSAQSNNTQAPANNSYDWQRELEASAYVVTEAQVSAGLPLILTIGTREAGMTIDRWVLNEDPALTDASLDALANSETSIVVQGANDAYVAFEAEAKATLINSTPSFWETKTDAAASAGAVLNIGGTTDVGTSPQSFAQYQIKFSKSGTYYLYYRWKADSARTIADQFTANSAWFAKVFGDFRTPGAAAQVDFFQAAANSTQAPANNVFDWQRELEANAYVVSEAEVTAGLPLILSVGSREAGMMIDRFVLSPDAALTDAALEALPNSGAVVVAPELVRAEGSASLDTVLVVFSKPLALASVLSTRFQLSGGVNVTSATVDPEDPRRVSLTTSAQTPGTSYTVTVNGVTDANGVAIAANSKIDFTAWKLVEGWATVEIYLTITGQTVDDLRNSAAFQAGKPDQVRWVKGFQMNNDPRSPNVGARISALFEAQASEVYNFYMNNDNQAELLLSSDQTEANLQSLGTLALTPPVFDENNVLLSAEALVTGRSYLLQGLVKSDGGDVYLNVAARPASGTNELSLLSGAQIATYVNPDLGNVTFLEQPANATVSAGARARFAVKVQTSESPVYFQWKVDGQVIVGANRSVYVTPVLSQTDSGKKYSVVVSVAGKETASAEATLTVNPGQPSNIQPYIGVNFTGGGDNLPGVLTTLDVAGVVAQEHWNNLTGTAFDAVALHDSAGAATEVTLTAAATEHWYSGTLGSGDANGVMLQGFLSAGASTEPLLITLNNVPAGKYNLVVYSIGFPFQASYEEDITIVASGEHPTYTVKAESGLEFNANPTFRRMNSTNSSNRAVGNYVQFDGVSPAADGSLVVSATWTSTNPGNGHQPAINAIQLLKATEQVARPTISFALQSNGSLQLSWTDSAAGFTLESSQTVGATASWSPLPGAPNPITVAGSTNINPAAGARFYRMRK